MPSRTLERRNRKYNVFETLWVPEIHKVTYKTNLFATIFFGELRIFRVMDVFYPFVFKIGKFCSSYILVSVTRQSFQCQNFKPWCWDVMCKTKFCSTLVRIYEVNIFISKHLVVTQNFIDPKSSNKVSSPILWKSCHWSITSAFSIEQFKTDCVTTVFFRLMRPSSIKLHPLISYQTSNAWRA